MPKAYADDISIYNDNKFKLKKSIKTIENWCHLNKIELNKGKSGIFKIRSR